MTETWRCGNLRIMLKASKIQELYEKWMDDAGTAMLDGAKATDPADKVRLDARATVLAQCAKDLKGAIRG